MKFQRTVKVAFSAILTNKMRSVLTMLGIIIGVLAVTMLISLGQGAQNEVTGRLSDLGTHLVLGNITTPRTLDITRENVGALADGTVIEAIAPELSQGATLSARGESETYTVHGSTPEYLSIRNLSLLYGENIHHVDVDTRQSVAVIGVNVARDLFGTDEAVGNTFNIEGKAFTVCGVLAEKGQSLMGSADDMVIVPISTAQRMFQNERVSSIYVGAGEDYNSDAQAKLTSFLMDKTGDDKAFSIVNQQEIVDMAGDISGMMTSLLGGIAAISLLVGGIGIMNIMLVSVTERTREIGIRKAIGAQKASIITQFLLEAVFISSLGGLIGLALGAGGLGILAPMMGMNMGVTPQVAVLALAFSMGIGVVFGIFPANKAANLEPIEALRYQ